MDRIHCSVFFLFKTTFQRLNSVSVLRYKILLSWTHCDNWDYQYLLGPTDRMEAETSLRNVVLNKEGWRIMPKILIIVQNTRFSCASQALCFTFERTYFEILNDPCHEISCSDKLHRHEHIIQCNSNVSNKCRLVTSSVPLCLQIMNSNN